MEKEELRPESMFSAVSVILHKQSCMQPLLVQQEKHS